MLGSAGVVSIWAIDTKEDTLYDKARGLKLNKQ